MNTDNKTDFVFPLQENPNMFAVTLTKEERERYLTLNEYLRAIKKATKQSVSLTALKDRIRDGEIDLMVYKEPVWKIDTKKFPPSSFVIKQRGRKPR